MVLFKAAVRNFFGKSLVLFDKYALLYNSNIFLL